MALEVLELKLVLMGVIFLSTTLVGVAPILLKGACGARINGVLRPTTRGRLLSCANCFSAGVFLFVCFLGLLPAADTKFHVILQELADQDPSWEAFAEFPWGFFVVTCSFLVMFTIDKLVHAIETERSKHHSSREVTSSSTSEVTLLSVKGSPTASTTPTSPCTDSSETPPLSHPPTHSSPTLEEYVALSLEENKKQNASAKSRQNSKFAAKQAGEFHLQLQEPLQGRVLASESCVILEKPYVSTSHGHGVPSSIIFLVALGIHSLFEGAAIGLQTEKEKVLEFGVAVLVHEVVMALTFGMEVSRSARLSWVWQVVYVFLFTVNIPVGIGIGAGLMQNTATQQRQIIAASLEAVATGIFIHVIFIEIISGEFPNQHSHEDSSHERHNDAVLPIDYHTVNAQICEIDDGVAPSRQKDGGAKRKNVATTHESSKQPSEIWLVCEKILSICAGLLLLILLNVFMHSDH